MIAIQTRYLGPTNFRGARVVAETMNKLGNDRPGRVTIAWDDALNPEENHREAARALLAKLDWDGIRHWVSGSSERGWVWVRRPIAGRRPRRKTAGRKPWV